MPSTRKSWPVLVLLAEVLVFFRHVLFYGHYAIPWDLRTYHLTQAWFMARSFARGDLPLWDPYTYCGMPFYANLTAQLFYPPTVAAVLLSNWIGIPLLYALELQLVAHVLLAGVLTWWLLRCLGADNAAALTGATVYQLGAYMASQTEHLGAIDAAAWLPLAWLAVVSLAERFRWRWLAALVLAFAMAILAGFPATTAVLFMTSFLLAGILMVLRRASWRLPIYVTIGAAWSILLAAVQVLPTLQLSRLSVAQYRSQFLGTGGGMPLQALVSLVLPNHYGIFQFDGSTWRLPFEVTFLYTYCGILPLALAIAAILLRRNRYTASCAWMALCAGLWMLGDSTPVGRAAFLLLPAAIQNSVYAQFALSAFTLSIALLAGLGAQQLFASRARWVQAAIVAMVAADLIAVSSHRPMNTVDEKQEPGISYRQYQGSPEIPRALRLMTNQGLPPWRTDIMQGPMTLASSASLFEYPSASGNDPFALVNLMQVRLSFCDGVVWGRYYEVAHPDSPVLKLMNVRYVLSNGPLEKPGSLVRSRDLPGLVVYENPDPLPRFFLVNRTRLAPNREAALAVLRSQGFDPRTEAVVEGVGALPQSTSPPGSVRVIDYSARGFTLETDSPAAAFLVTSEAGYPGWQAWIDGQPHQPVLTNVAFRGLPVPAGRHQVKMRFDPPILWRSAALSLAAACALLLACWFGGRASGTTK